MTTTTALMISDCISNWAAKIRQIWSEGGARTIDLAKATLAARQELKRGEWTALWLDGNMPFSKRKAEMLVLIGRNLTWANAQTFAHLPHSWSTLYYLARLGRKQVEDLIANGIVTPDLKLFEAKQLLKPVSGSFKTFTSASIQSELRRFSTFIEKTHRLWSPDDTEAVVARLNKILCLLECAPFNHSSELCE